MALDSPTRFNEYCEFNVTEIPSRKGVKKAIKKGELILNGEKSHGGVILNEGDTITLVDLENTPPKTYHLKLNVVYEDDDIAVIWKPAGINVSGNQFKTIQNALMFNLKQSNKSDALAWPKPVHRIDNQTSGLLIVAKTKTARVNLGQKFENRDIQKTYYAIVIGEIIGAGSIESQIEGKNAVSEYKSIKLVDSLKNKKLSLLQLKPITGRTHQLRIHCSKNLIAPILGDKIYGKPGMVLKNKGLFLTSTGLEFKHPITNQILNLTQALPHKFHQRLNSEQKRFDNYI